MVVAAVARGTGWRSVVADDDGVTVRWVSQYTYRLHGPRRHHPVSRLAGTLPRRGQHRHDPRSPRRFHLHAPSGSATR